MAVSDLVDGGGIAVGLDAFDVDARLRLFWFAARSDRHEYLWVLRAFDRARRNYRVVLSEADVRELLAELPEDYGDDGPRDIDVGARCDALCADGILDRSHDGARATTIQEYRQRLSVYQFTEAGYIAYRAVEEVLGSRLDQADLGRLTFPEILADLRALAEANRRGDGDEVWRKLRGLDRALAEMADRAARFYLTLGDLGRSHDVRPEVFLRHKDALLAHMGEFQSELVRYTPRLAQAVGAVEATGVEALLDRAALADGRPLRSAVDRLDDWRLRWHGLVGWFRPVGERPSHADRLQAATVSAIGDVLSLLRRVTEARRGGLSRESQMRHLAAWFAAMPDSETAHALFSATFNLRSARHVAVAHDDPEALPASTSWWDAPPVTLSRTLRERGKRAAPGPPAAVVRNEPVRRTLLESQRERQEERRSAAASLLAGGLEDRRLGEAETALFLDLLSRALGARPPVGTGATATAAAAGIRLRLTQAAATTTVATCRGVLRLCGVRAEILAADTSVASHRSDRAELALQVVP